MSLKKKQHASPAALMSTTGSLPPGPIVADDGPPAADEPAPAASDDASASSDVHAVETLAAGYGATAEQVSSLVCAIGAKAIASAAARGATTKVCDEAYAAADKARAFFLRKPAATVAQLRMGEVVVKVLVTCAAHASAARREAGERVAAQRSAAPADSVAHGVAFTRARAGSRQLGNALRGVCAGDGAALERVRVAGQPRRGGHLDAGPGRALVSLVALGRALLDDAAYATRCEAWGVTAAWLDELAAVAAEAQESTRAKQVPAPAAADTSDERRWRGLTVILLRRVFGAFAAGSAVDASIAKLGLRYLPATALGGRRARKPAAAKSAPTKPAGKARGNSAAPATPAAPPTA